MKASHADEECKLKSTGRLIGAFDGLDAVILGGVTVVMSICGLASGEIPGISKKENTSPWGATMYATLLVMVS